ncbi:MAG: hypothetical protein ACPGXK_01325 [Phycisphaerae bacterium]
MRVKDRAQNLRAVLLVAIMALCVGGHSVLAQSQSGPRKSYQVPEGLKRGTYYFNMSSGQGGAIAGENMPEGFDDPVYSNTPPESLFLPPGVERPIADDLRTVALGGCNTTGYEIKVVRGERGCALTGAPCETDVDCFGDVCQPYADPGFSVDFALYDGCPNDGGQIIPGSQGTASFDENGIYTIVVDFGDAPVQLDRLLWVQAEFDRLGAGWVIGTPAQTGFTGNFYDFPVPAFFCDAQVAITSYAGFHTRVFCSDDPPFVREFLSYSNPELDGLTVTHPAGSNQWLVDDVRPIVDDCLLTSLEIGVVSPEPVTVTTEIWRSCSPTTKIQGTTQTFDIIGGGLAEIARFDYAGGIQIDNEDELHVAFKFSNASAAGIIAGFPTLGETDPTLGIFGWVDDGCIWGIGTQHVGFSINVSCEGEAPLGACCDMSDALEGEPFCTETNQLGCRSLLSRYSQGMSCPLTCTVDNTTCETDADCVPAVCSESLTACGIDGDCPEGETCEAQTCVQLGESFEPACGDAACCTPPESPFGETCVNLPRDDCRQYEDNNGNQAVWNVSTQCETPNFGCFRWLCRFAEGDCSAPHAGVGCSIPSCCDQICDQDSWCCEVEWDQTCVDRVNDPDFGCLFECFDPCDCADTCECADTVDISTGLCSNGSPCDFNNGNEDCPGLEVCNNPSIKMNVAGANGGDDAFFCCSSLPLGSAGAGSVWSKFVAVSSTMKITTSDGLGPGDAVDAVMQIFRSDAPDGSCESLTLVGCDDNSGPGNQAELLFNDLEVGKTYYIQLAGNGPNAQGQYKVTFDWPIGNAPNRPANDRCEAAQSVASSGSFDFNLANATYDCPWETCLPAPELENPTRMDNDIWYSYFPIANGVVTVDTCGEEDTTIAVYEGGTCPPDAFERVACNDDGPDGCSPGSLVSFTVTGGQLYSIRLGDADGNTPSGTITFSEIVGDCQPNAVPDSEDISSGNSYDLNNNQTPDECDPCDLTSMFPMDGQIDARQPFPPTGGPVGGIDRVFLGNVKGCDLLEGVAPDQFSLDSFFPPAIDSTENIEGDVYVVFDGPLPIGSWTLFEYDVPQISACVGYLPGDVNASRLVNGQDVRALVDSLSGKTPLGIESTDMDRNGVAEPEDLLRLVDLINGGQALPSYWGIQLSDTLCVFE